VTPRTVYRLINAGELPGYRIGRLVQIQTADIIEFIDSARITPGEL
jgi:excisionase family DNA binding protein